MASVRKRSHDREEKDLTSRLGCTHGSGHSQWKKELCFFFFLFSSSGATMALKEDLLKPIWHAFTALDVDKCGKVSKSQLKVKRAARG